MEQNNVAEIYLSYLNSEPGYHPDIRSTIDAHKALLTQYKENTIDLQPSNKIMLLSRSPKLIGIYNHSAQGFFESYYDKRVILIAALKANALSFIFARSYPNGSLEATEADKAIYYDLIEAGNTIDLPLADYLIYNRQGVHSLREMKTYLKNDTGDDYTTIPYDFSQHLNP